MEPDWVGFKVLSVLEKYPIAGSIFWTIAGWRDLIFLLNYFC
jgi:hypothetical protein